MKRLSEEFTTKPQVLKSKQERVGVSGGRVGGLSADVTNSTYAQDSSSAYTCLGSQ